jgi:aryl-alcohol dehydrogenase-like predicted oxidoreductase
LKVTDGSDHSTFGLMSDRHVTLGTSGIEVSAIGLGCWQFSGGRGLAGGYWAGLPQEQVNQIVARALALGISWFDTAEIYGNGESERSLSAALEAAGASAETIIATKWRPFLRFAGSITGTYPERERLLDPFKITLHQVHAPASFSSVASQMERMADLVDAGRLRAVGVSNFSAAQMAAADDALRARGMRLASNQMRYSLLDRRIEQNGVLELARERNITIIAYSPLEQGILTGRFHRDPEAVKRLKGPRRLLPVFKPSGLERVRPLIEVLERVSAELDATPAQVSLAWLIQRNAPHVVVIPGASTVSQVESNARAMELELSDAVRDEIDEASLAVAR